MRSALTSTVNMDAQKLLDDISLDFTAHAKRLGMNGLFLRDIIHHRSRGRDMAQTAQRMGVCRDTVSKYLKKLRALDHNEFVILFSQALLLKSGVFALHTLLSMLSTIEEKRKGSL